MARRNTTLEYLTTTKIGEKGQLTAPKQFREELGLDNGAPFAVLCLGMASSSCPSKRFDQLCAQVNPRLTDVGLRPDDLIAALPEARNRVYARLYGKRTSAGPARHRSRIHRGK